MPSMTCTKPDLVVGHPRARHGPEPLSPLCSLHFACCVGIRSGSACGVLPRLQAPDLTT